MSPCLHVECELIRDVCIQDSTSGELFAQVSYASPYTQVEPVTDSSRYFVLRMEGEGGKRAYVGVGFAERGEAFDFQVGRRYPPQSPTLPSYTREIGRPVKQHC